MKPAQVDLPTIWKGQDGYDVRFQWKDARNNPVNLQGWTFYAQTKDFDLFGEILDSVNGVTRVLLGQNQSGALKLGVYQWNCWFIDPLGNISPPLLAGKVPVKARITVI